MSAARGDRARRFGTAVALLVIAMVSPGRCSQSGGCTMPATISANPISDLMYDWLTVLQSKAEGINAYEKYIEDAEKENAQECVELFRKLHDQDVRQAEEIKRHLEQMMSGGKFGG